MFKVENMVLLVDCVNEQEGIENWHRAFSTWARGNQANPPTDTMFKEVDGQMFLSGEASIRP